jgi:hypothetical protein
MTVMVLFGILSSLFYFGLEIVQKSSGKLMKSFNEEIELTNLMTRMEFLVSDSDSIIFTEKQLSIFNKEITNAIVLSENKLEYGSENESEILQFDSLQFEIVEADINRIISFTISININQKEYYYFFSNRKKI